jgi:hypothetical protein
MFGPKFQIATITHFEVDKRFTARANGNQLLLRIAAQEGMGADVFLPGIFSCCACPWTRAWSWKAFGWIAQVARLRCERSYSGIISKQG